MEEQSATFEFLARRVFWTSKKTRKIVNESRTVQYSLVHDSFIYVCTERDNTVASCINYAAYVSGQLSSALISPYTSEIARALPDPVYHSVVVVFFVFQAIFYMSFQRQKNKRWALEAEGAGTPLGRKAMIPISV